MSKRKVVILTIFHFVAVCLLWAGALVVALGFGFEENWGVLEYSATGFIASGLAIMALPTWVIASFGPPDWAYIPLVSLQLVISYLEVKIACKVWSWWQSREKT
ncbi:hypothetical protein [Microbulbifer hydrolyticus]|uniref:Uncharacterized protein n=1 Tax=Microbulbifer hydrolyticus TaxID=48074 RepID=A0A6P1TAE5_9GAMM|nr:hypothetical protein [Microbulbifer hydrolyticus]MBB5213309.1 hypothetical protein [Microbulbifer hydrolyticus]QHQ38606.1 hypothetical protein GTQ55_06130 [Microbulbifer hydrolyticus]